MSRFDLHGYGPLLLEGARLTVYVGVCAMALAVLLGLIGMWCKFSPSPLVRFVVDTYTTVVRGVPELVLILLVYYGVPTFIQDVSAHFGRNIYIALDPFTAGVATIGFIYGAFATEVFRGARLAVPKGQIEAARACGMSGPLTFRRILLPQMMRFALPGLGNVWMILIKATALISVIQLPELMRSADIAARNTRKPFTFFFAASLIYLAITIISNIVQHWAERRAARGLRRA
ncbi:ABC transporter permease [Desulfatitalea alkaliphila]|uniref:ABC transporter permease n=1 Tax=Desulfatitalea alkaliphila TaxID=2929485 RepID=A0AA41R5G6_9BACT|nr:ABC transporter permease [Desulfatitalea alkaliphila]